MGNFCDSNELYEEVKIVPPEVISEYVKETEVKADRVDVDVEPSRMKEFIAKVPNWALIKKIENFLLGEKDRCQDLKVEVGGIVDEVTEEVQLFLKSQIEKINGKYVLRMIAEGKEFRKDLNEVIQKTFGKLEKGEKTYRMNHVRQLLVNIAHSRIQVHTKEWKIVLSLFRMLCFYADPQMLGTVHAIKRWASSIRKYSLWWHEGICSLMILAIKTFGEVLTISNNRAKFNRKDYCIVSWLDYNELSKKYERDPCELYLYLWVFYFHLRCFAVYKKLFESFLQDEIDDSKKVSWLWCSTKI